MRDIESIERHLDELRSEFRNAFNCEVSNELLVSLLEEQIASRMKQLIIRKTSYLNSNELGAAKEIIQNEKQKGDQGASGKNKGPRRRRGGDGVSEPGGAGAIQPRSA